MATRPQTLYGLADSPVDLAAWLIDHGDGDDQPAATVLVAMRRDAPGRLTRDDVLDNITLYWLTNTGVSSARSYWENKTACFDPKNFSIPVAISVFPDELYQASRSWAERAYPKNLIHYHEARPRRALRRVGTAAALRVGDACRVQVAALIGGRRATPSQRVSRRRRVARLRRSDRLAELGTADARGPAGACRPRQLRHLHLHQLDPLASLRAGVGGRVRRATGWRSSACRRRSSSSRATSTT